MLGWPKRMSVGTGGAHRQEAKSWTPVSEVGDKHADLRGAEKSEVARIKRSVSNTRILLRGSPQSELGQE